MGFLEIGNLVNISSITHHKRLFCFCLDELELELRLHKRNPDISMCVSVSLHLNDLVTV